MSGGVSSTETLTLVGTFPCEILPMSGKEYQGLGGTANELTYRITMRYLKGITSSHIGIYDGRRFRFKAVMNVSENGREIQIVAVEGK
jgi:SPP1 family predicted phage head-tail adaptor